LAAGLPPRVRPPLEGLGRRGRHRLLQEPEAFKAFAIDQESFKAGLQREAMLHLFFPDEFEPIISEQHKKQIVKTFEDLLTEPTDDADRALLPSSRT
jgi:5-methylcytosine-specific restriction enzyme B